MNATPPSASPPESARSLAARVVTRVVDEGAFSSITLRYQLAASTLEGRDRGFTTELVYGTVTWLTPIDEALEAWMTQGLGSVPPLARAVLRVATYELLRPNRPGAAHAVVDAAVSQMHAIGLGRISGLTNAVLRKIARFGAPFAAHPDASSAATLATSGSLPLWIAERLLAERGPEGAAAAMAAWNGSSATHLRLRTQLNDALRETFTTEGIEPHRSVPGCFVMRSGSAIKVALQLGDDVAVQDAGAQWIGLVAADGLPENARIWDVCAGLGSKALHLAELLPQAQVLATDLHAHKLNAARKAAGTLPGLRFLQADATAGPPADEAGPFDLILLDAPCSGLGTIGRHPEVRWRRTPEDLTATSTLQRRLLETSAPHLAVGGRLVYAVCSWAPEEGREVIRDFLARHADFAEEPLPGESEQEQPGRLLFPDTDDTDGFFVARLRRLC